MRKYPPVRCARQSQREPRPLVEPLEARLVLAAEVLGSADGAGSLTLSYMHPAGVSVLQETPGQAPRLLDIETGTGCPDLLSAVLSWTDPQDGLVHGAAPSDQGLIVFRNRSSGPWSWRNLSDELQQPGITNLTVFMGMDGTVNVAGLLDSGDVAVYSKAGADWAFRNLSDDLRAEGLPSPAFAGKLVSYVTAWDGRNIAGLDAAGNVQAVWWAPGIANDHWRADNLSELTGAPRFSGSLAPYVTSWGGINLAGTDPEGKITVTWWVPGNPWRTSNLSDEFGGPPLEPSSLSSYVTPWGGLNIVGSDTAGRMTVYWWAPGKELWEVSADLVPGAVQPGGPITGIASATGTINLVAQSADASVLRYFWNPGDGGMWHFQDLSASAQTIAGGLTENAVDFLDITGMARTLGKAWEYNITGEGFSTTGVGRVSPTNHKRSTWTMSVNEPPPDALVAYPSTTFERRNDGVYLLSLTSTVVSGGSGDGAVWNFDDLKITPPVLSGTFTDVAPFTIDLPPGIDGHFAGTATASTSYSGRVMENVPQLGAFRAAVITLTIDAAATGWLDVGDIDGDGAPDGPQNVALREVVEVTFYAVPGIGSVRISQAVTVMLEADGESDSISATSEATLQVMSNTAEGTLPALAGRPPSETTDVSLQRVSAGAQGEPALSSRIELNKRTWVIVHGRNGTSDHFLSLAAEISHSRPDDQVLVLDWRHGARDNSVMGGLLDGAAWIESVADWTVTVLAGLGIDSSNTFLVGHSWGSFVAYEVAKNTLGDGDRIVALDPAAGAVGYWHPQVDFASVSSFSWSFYGSGLFGSAQRSATADEAVRIVYSPNLPFTEVESAFYAHQAPVHLFEQLIKRQREEPLNPRAVPFALAHLITPLQGRFVSDAFGDFEAQFTVNDGNGDLRWAYAWDEILMLEYYDPALGLMSL